MDTKITSRVTKGVIIAGILVALDLAMQKFYNASVPDGTRYMPRLIIVFLGILVSCIIYNKQSGGGLAFGDLFSHGLKTTALVAFLLAAYTFIAVKFIYPPPGAAEMEAAVKSIEQGGNALHQEAVQQAAEGAKNRWVIYVSVSIFASLIPGLLGSVLAAATLKKKQ